MPIHPHPSRPIQIHLNHIPTYPSSNPQCRPAICMLLGYLRMCYNAPWQNCANMGSPTSLTMTARTASKFCAKSWSRDKDIFDLDLISPSPSEKEDLDVYVPSYPTMQRVLWPPVPSPHPGAGGRRRRPQIRRGAKSTHSVTDCVSKVKLPLRLPQVT